MATIARQETYKDLDFSFKQNPNTNDVGIKKDNASISQSVLNILQTNTDGTNINLNTHIHTQPDTGIDATSQGNTNGPQNP